MGLFDKVKQMKADYDAKKAEERAEVMALCNRIKENDYFLSYGNAMYNFISDITNENVKWAAESDIHGQRRKLAVFVRLDGLGFAQVYDYDQRYTDNNGKTQKKVVHRINMINFDDFSELGMQELPNLHKKGNEIRNTVLDTITSKLTGIEYATLHKEHIRDDENGFGCDIAMTISIDGKKVNGMRNAW